MEEDVRFCPDCGVQISKVNSKRRPEASSIPWKKIIPIAVAVAVLATGAYLFLHEEGDGGKGRKVQEKPEFKVSNLSIDEPEVNTGQKVVVSVDVKNIGQAAGKKKLEFEIRGETRTITVSLEPGNRRTVSFPIIRRKEGTYNVKVSGLSQSFKVVALTSPAEFEVTSLKLNPHRAELGENVKATVHVKNIGENRGSYTIALKLSGTVIENENITLGGGEETKKAFTFSVSQPATWDVTVENLSETLIACSPSFFDVLSWIKEKTSRKTVIGTMITSHGDIIARATGRPTVLDDNVSVEKKGEWQNQIGKEKPPDYIKYQTGGKEYIYGKNAPIRKGQTNGRIIDMRRLIMTGDEDVAEFILKTYQEKYDIPIKYVVFNNSASGDGTLLQSTLISTARDMETTKNASQSNGSYVFSFDKENVRYNFTTSPVTQDNETLRGVVFYNTQSRRVTNYRLNPNSDSSKILWILIESQEGILQLGQNLWVQGAGLGDMGEIPFLMRALKGYEMPYFLKEAYRSPHGQAAVYKVVPDNLS